jgi:peptidoglycan glycosyltransferase/penicillin-binding protein 2
MARQLRNMIKSRVKSFYFISAMIFLGLVGRLYYIQIYDSEDLKFQGLKQRSIEINLMSKRGTIYDRNGIPITNRDITKVLIAPGEIIVNNKELYEKVKENTTLSLAEMNEVLKSQNKLVQIPLKREIDIEDNHNMFIVDITERYSKDNILSHVIGYVNKAENRGEFGIEKVYDEFLNKSDRESLFVEYDKFKSLVLGSSYYADNAISSEEPSAVKLTIDYNIQKKLEEILDQNHINGSVIVADVKSAEILAMGSRPSFNPNHMEQYFTRNDMVLYNKAVQVSYPPGSIFKIAVLLAALEEDENFMNREFYCKGYEELGKLIINCNNIYGHGHISLKDGFAKSCNSVFIQIGKEIGAKKIIDMAKTLGFGEKVGIGLIEEVGGILPEGEELLGPAIGNISIGQGKLEATPLQITNMLLTIANNGIQKDMTIVQGITNKDGRIIKAYNTIDDLKIISNKSSKIVRELLEEVVNTGTGKNIDAKYLGGAAGKTGSAEGTLNGKPTIYGWFAGYFPIDDPQYVITVLVEEANSGSKSALPIFEKISKEIISLNR